MRRQSMRRTVLAVAATLAVLGAATATGVSLAGTSPEMTTVNVCAAAVAPKASCFAKLRVEAATGVAPFAAAPSGYGPGDLTSAYAVPSGAGAGRTVAI